MLTRKKRNWAALSVNMTPLIDVVFLIIIFFIILINFSEKHIREVQLPKADEARPSQTDKTQKVLLVIKSDELIFLQRKKVDLPQLSKALMDAHPHPLQMTVQIRADKDIPYAVLKKVMATLAKAGYSKIELSTLKDAPDPLGKDGSDEI